MRSEDHLGTRLVSFIHPPACSFKTLVKLMSYLYVVADAIQNFRSLIEGKHRLLTRGNIQLPTPQCNACDVTYPSSEPNIISPEPLVGAHGTAAAVAVPLCLTNRLHQGFSETRLHILRDDTANDLKGLAHRFPWLQRVTTPELGVASFRALLSHLWLFLTLANMLQSLAAARKEERMSTPNTESLTTQHSPLKFVPQ
ncbi:uncharacterized protein CLUP02_15573 [Colletotrichum lupini]|uniref:Uncharacterized protein n=1 Tax=Colletotrichum lupini TaxID=145971 RepID=A0A9Q8T6H6_9PEZI|nr:uncharacterized protein CLUP02_15573 [Colletotrichum lupini]UQC90042.1 hypothetical protein CLUP02_15573 [Colletotrichum lupini]